MDRYDEKRTNTDDLTVRTDEVSEHEVDVREGDTDPEVRQGDILGLGGTEVPKAPGDPSAEHDPSSVAQRRARALGTDEPTPAEDNRQGGATGIDMGAGGQGTLIRGQ